MEEQTKVSIVIPCRNERDNIPTVVKQVRAALDSYPYEVVVVAHRCTDDTAQVAEAAGARVVVCTEPHLADAMLCGFNFSVGSSVIWMDGDGQHPPDALPNVIEALKRSEVVVASRNVKGGGYVGFSKYRRLVSSVANLLALPLLPRIKDRMSGFFGIRRNVLNGHIKLNPLGYKFALEVLVKGEYKTSEEVPFVFLPRLQGESKLSGKVMSAYLKQLLQLYSQKPLFRFALVGAFGTIVKLSSMYVCVEYLHLHFMLAYFVSFVLSVTSNYTWNSLWTFKQKASKTGMGKYVGVSLISLCINETLIYILTGVLGVWYMASTVIAILVAFILNFTLSRRWVWKRH